MRALNVVDQILLPPQGPGTVRALARIGYELSDALADIIDNSIDAGASKVEVTFLRNDREITAVTIADDGRGMDSEGLKVAMQFAGRASHHSNELGTYGMGLKSASFSQCSSMTVISRRDSKTLASRWNYETIGRDWHCDILDPDAAVDVFNQLCMKNDAPTTGTLVIWERLDRLAVGRGPDALDEFLNTALPRLEAHLGLTFHRFLHQGSLDISIVVRHERRSLAIPRIVRAHDPFDYSQSGSPSWPKTLSTHFPGIGSVDLRAHIWPAGSSTASFLLGTKKGIEYQGFYFYRNNRLIQAGGWNGVVKSKFDPTLVLARVAIELPPGGTEVNIQKSSLQVTAAQAQALAEANDGEIDLLDYLEASRSVYRADRRGNELTINTSLVPGHGMPARVRYAAAKRLSKNREADEISFGWEQLEEGRIFELNLTDMRIVLNREYRSAILGDAPATGADIPFIKMLLFLLFKDDFVMLRSSRKRQERIDLCNALLFDIVRMR